jgi:2-keto-4-pentenoate hydratase/2-oxohepta-3-ene-1,7-dioic acid hydratase in catechol pathway
LTIDLAPVGEPGHYLRAGDVVEVDVGGIGTLTNPVEVV